MTGIKGRLGIWTEEKQGGSLVQKGRSRETLKGTKMQGTDAFGKDCWNSGIAEWKLLMDLGN